MLKYNNHFKNYFTRAYKSTKKFITYPSSLSFFLGISVEVQEMEINLPKTCKTHFSDANKLHQFSLTITPEDGFWSGGKYSFHVDVSEEYNIVVRYKFICL